AHGTASDAVARPRRHPRRCRPFRNGIHRGSRPVGARGVHANRRAIPQHQSQPPPDFGTQAHLPAASPGHGEIHMSGARDLIDDTLELASLPAVVLRALELLNAPDSSAADIGQVISEDPALSVRLLRIVNSSFYGFPSRIETISRAITIVGTLEITDLVLGSSAVEAFAGLPNELIDMQ